MPQVEMEQVDESVVQKVDPGATGIGTESASGVEVEYFELSVRERTQWV